MRIPLLWLLLSFTLIPNRLWIADFSRWLRHDPDRRVPFFNDATYSRDEYDWWVRNTGQFSRLFLSGVYQSEETGTNDIGLLAAWRIQPNANGIKVGVIDMANGHAGRIMALVSNVAPGSEQVFIGLNRWAVAEFSSGIYQCSTSGCRIIIMAEGFSFADDGLSNACRFAESNGVIICCAVPNVDGDLDTTLIDYPYSWARDMDNILPVSATDRNGLHLSPSGTGTNAIGAPGRNIVASGTYSSGTSYATPIAAGCVALLAAKFPGDSSKSLLEKVRTSTDTVPLVKRINPVRILSEQ